MCRFQRVIHKSLSPVWNETFEIEVPETAMGLPLALVVQDYDRMSLNDFMGRVTIRLDDLSTAKGGGEGAHRSDSGNDGGGGREEMVAEEDFLIPRQKWQSWHTLTNKEGQSEGHTYGEIELELHW